MKWLLFVVLTGGSYPIATVTETRDYAQCEEYGIKAQRFSPDNTRWYCVEKKP